MSTNKRVPTRFTGVFYRHSKNNDKTFYIVYKDEDSKNKELKIGKYSEGVREAYCNQKRNEIITKQRLGEEPPAIAQKKKISNDNTLNKLFDYYYENKKLHNRHIEADKSSYNKHIKDTLGPIPIEKLTAETIRTFQANKIEALAEKTVNNLTGLINTVVEFAIKNDRIKNIENIVRKVKSFKVDNVREKYLEIDEIDKLYQSVEHDEELFIFTKLLLSTGARLEGVYSISIHDVNFTNNVIKIKDFKNNSTYNTFFNDELSELLSTRFKSNNEVLFNRSQTQLQKLLRHKLNDLFNKNIDPSDRKNRVVVHTLRHTFASHLAINETPIFTIQKLLNHKDIKMTMRYAKLAPDSGRESVYKLKF